MRIYYNADGRAEFIYTTGDCAAVCNVKLQTFRGWIKYSNILESQGRKRIIPKPVIIINGFNLFSKEQLEEIKKFANDKKRGDLSEYSMTSCGKKGQVLQEKRELKRQLTIKRNENLENSSRGGLAGNLTGEERLKRLKSLL
jgi:hypothetical protein